MTTDYDIADTPDTFARVPPSSLEAEQCILGGMTMTRQAIIDAIDELDGVEAPFYRPAHETIYRTILGLYARNEPVDPITLTAALKKSDGAKLSKAVQALQEPLSQIAEKVATAG